MSLLRNLTPGRWAVLGLVLLALTALTPLAFVPLLVWLLSAPRFIPPEMSQELHRMRRPR